MVGCFVGWSFACCLLQVISDAEEHGAAVLGVPMKATVKVNAISVCEWFNGHPESRNRHLMDVLRLSPVVFYVGHRSLDSYPPFDIATSASLYSRDPYHGVYVQLCGYRCNARVLRVPQEDPRSSSVKCFQFLFLFCPVEYDDSKKG